MSDKSQFQAIGGSTDQGAADVRFHVWSGRHKHTSEVML
jgi:hypothetical protein